MDVDIPLNLSFPILAVGGATLLISLLFCCYLWRLRRQGRSERGYKKVSLRSFQRQKKASNDTCPVCLDEFRTKEDIALCPCGHGFHVKCLIQWLEMRNTCPMCKTRVKSEPSERTGLVFTNMPVTEV